MVTYAPMPMALFERLLALLRVSFLLLKISGQIGAQRNVIATQRRQRKIFDGADRRLEEELYWTELHAGSREEMELLNTLEEGLTGQG